MILCQLVDKTGILGSERFPVYPIVGDYLSVYGNCYRVVDRVITHASDSRKAILFLARESPSNSAIDEWRNSPTDHRE